MAFFFEYFLNISSEFLLDNLDASRVFSLECFDVIDNILEDDYLLLGLLVVLGNCFGVFKLHALSKFKL
jgi:hypothetical protein